MYKTPLPRFNGRSTITGLAPDANDQPHRIDLSPRAKRQKLNAVLQADEENRKLDGHVEMDDAVMGGKMGELDGGERGRGGPNKIPPFVVALRPAMRDSHNALRFYPSLASIGTRSNAWPRRIWRRALASCRTGSDHARLIKINAGKPGPIHPKRGGMFLKQATRMVCHCNRPLEGV